MYLLAISVVKGLMWNIRRDSKLPSLYWLISDVFHTVLYLKRFCVFTGAAGGLATQGIGNFMVDISVLSAVRVSVITGSFH